MGRVKQGYNRTQWQYPTESSQKGQGHQPCSMVTGSTFMKLNGLSTTLEGQVENWLRGMCLCCHTASHGRWAGLGALTPALPGSVQWTSSKAPAFPWVSTGQGANVLGHLRASPPSGVQRGAWNTNQTAVPIIPQNFHLPTSGYCCSPPCPKWLKPPSFPTNSSCHPRFSTSLSILYCS